MYQCRNATFEDIGGILEIENARFADLPGVSFTKEQIINWFNHNPNMFYVVVDENETVMGFTIIAPITEECFNKLSVGDINDMTNFEITDIGTNKESMYYYFADIACRDKGFNSSIVSSLLLKEIIGFLSINSDFVITTAITDEGLNKLKRFGFIPCDNKEKKAEKNINCILDVKLSENIIKEQLDLIERIINRYSGKAKK